MGDCDARRGGAGMNRTQYGHLVLNTLVFFAIWLILSGKFTVIYMTLGLAVSFGIAWLNEGQMTWLSHTFRWYSFLLYLPWLFSRIVASSIHMAYLILHPAMPIDPKLITHSSRLRNRHALVLLSNSITLTPGTITAEVSDGQLTVHAIDGGSTKDLVSGRLEDKVSHVFAKEAKIT